MIRPSPRLSLRHRGRRFGTVPLALALIALTLVTTSWPVLAGTKEGISAYRAGDYETARIEFEPVAETDPEARYYLGTMYEAGYGVPRSYEKALELYRSAGDQGYVPAQYHLGLLFENGEGVGRDYTIAFEWYKRAAERGYAPAQINLGLLYQFGRGVETSHLLAHVWFALAEEQDYPGAKKNRMNAARFLSTDEIALAERMTGRWKATEN